MKYFVNEEERRFSGSTCYIEFQRGAYDGHAWRSDSISMDEELFYDLKLKKLFSEVLPQFDYFGINPVSLEEFMKIKILAKDFSEEIQEVVQELEDYFQDDLNVDVLFTICGI